MPEGNANLELAQHLTEHGRHAGGGEGGDTRSRRHIEIVEILEAVLLAIVALSTALSGYQAARWDGESAKMYASASSMRVQQNALQLSANQQLMADASTFTAWLGAHEAGDTQLQLMLQRRYSAPYETAFKAWLKTDPFHDPQAPPGPGYMPEYENPTATKAKEVAKTADEDFREGVHDRAVGENYVRVTVILAAVLFLIAVGQRFRVRGVRLAVSTVAGAFLVYCVVLLITYPHA